MITLRGAFFWECPECQGGNFLRATEGFLPHDAARVAQGDPPDGEYDCHYTTADAVENSDPEAEHNRQSAYLVRRVLCAPSFVTCSECDRTFPAHVIDDDEIDTP